VGAEATANVIRARFNTQFTAAEATVSIFYPNVLGVVPDNTEFVRYSQQSGSMDQSSMGAPAGGTWSRVGQVIVQVFTPKDLGDKRALELADVVMAIFQGENDTGVWFRDVSVVDIGATGSLYQVNVVVTYESLEVAV
jgi:hypothetical protein